jgi:Na+-translocating ferredoxin:NAD+ oxidoreductase subunit B
MDKTVLARQVHDALPQTQCTRCGYPDCEAYAQAIVYKNAPINQCPPGGAQGISRLSALTGQPIAPLNPVHGVEAPRNTIWIDENWCIGCTLCIKACPVDAIVGTHKRMHTVIESACTGCELCIPVCPVDCMVLENTSGQATGWSAWSSEQAAQARERHATHQTRQQQRETQRQQQHLATLELKAVDLPAHSQIQNPELLDRKKSVIEMALARARAKQAERP